MPHTTHLRPARTSRLFLILFLLLPFTFLLAPNLIAQGDGGEPPFTPPEPPALPLLSLAAAPVTINEFPAPTTPLTVTITNHGNGPATSLTLQLDGGLFTYPISQTLGTLEAGQSLTTTLSLELLGYALGEQELLLTAYAQELINPIQTTATLIFLEPAGATPFTSPESALDNTGEEKDETDTIPGETKLPQFHLLQAQYPLFPSYRGRILTFSLSNSQGYHKDLNLALSQWLPGLDLTADTLQLAYLPATVNVSSDSESQLPPSTNPQEITFTYNSDNTYLTFTPAGDGQYFLTTDGGQGESLNGTPEDPQGWVPTFNAPTVSLFSGSVAYQYPLTTPPGPGLFQPTLALTYNSGAGNGLSSRVQGDVAGFGWNLAGNIEVSQAVTFCVWDTNKLCPSHYWEDEAGPHAGLLDLTLSLGGTGYELTHVNGSWATGYGGRYTLKGNTSFYVEYCHQSGSGNSPLCAAADSGDGTADGRANDTTSQGFWVIKDNQGTLYRLGYTTLSEQEFRTGINYFINDSTMGPWAGDHAPAHALRWRVDQIKDRFNNITTTTTYTYEEVIPATDVRVPSSYLKQIDYGYNRIVFNYVPLAYSNLPSGSDGPFVTWQTQILSSIVIQTKNYNTGGGNFNPIRTYELVHAYERHGSFPDGGDPGIPNQSAWCRSQNLVNMWNWYLPSLIKITELDANGQARVRVPDTANPGTYLNKPDVEFAHWWYRTAYWSDGSNNNARYCAPYLTEVHTPYNPTAPVASFAYEQNDNNAYHNANAPAGTATWFNPVISQTINSGWTVDAPPQTTLFAYNGPHYGAEAVGNQWNSYYGAFQGFLTITRTSTLRLPSPPNTLVPHLDEVNRFQAYIFWDSNSPLTGKLEWQEIRAHDTHAILARSVEEWDMLNGVPSLTQSSQYSPYYGPNSSHNVGTRTEYTYDNYGNPAQVREYGGTLSGGTPYRVQETLYVHNTNPANWLIGLPWRVTVWDGEPNPSDPSKIISRQRTRYDGAGCDAGGTQIPVSGLVTATDIYNPGLGDGNCLGGTQGNDYLTTRTDYGQNGDWPWQPTRIISPVGVYPDNNTQEQIIYWRNHSLIEKISNSLGETLYGFNDTHTPWLFTDKTVPNGAKTRYEYDNFGRLIKQYTPDPLSWQVTVLSQQIIYYDNAPATTGSPLYIDAITVPGQGYSATSRTFYDALGRARQQRSWNLASDFDKVVTDTEYNSLGQVICQTTPIVTTYTTFNATLNCLTSDHTATSYTRSGSPAITTGIDGLTSSGLTLGRTSLGVDPLNQLSLSVQDPFGRLSVVAETEVTENSFTTGTFSSTNWWLSSYATPTTLNGQSVLRVGKTLAGGSTSVATVNQTFFGGNNSYFFRFQLSGNNHDSRIMAKATDGSGAYLSLELRDGKIYPRYNSSAGSGSVTEIQINQVSNAWYRAQISLNDLGQPTWRVWREDGIGEPDKQFTYTLVNQSINTLLLSKTWQFTLAPGTNGEGTAYFYLGAYQQGKYNLTRYTYDKANNLSAVTDAAGNVTTLTYDKLGRKLTMSDPDMGTWTYAYDLAGNLIRQTDAKYQRLCFTYDLQNRLLNKKDDGFYSGSGADNCVGGGTTLASYTYHSSGMGRGQVATIQGTNNGVTFNDSFSYDYRGRVTSTSRTIAGTPYILSTTYDLLDRPLALTYPGGEVVTTVYDKQVANQLKTSALPTGQFLVSDVTYNHRLEMTGMVLGNNLTQSYVYFSATENYRLDKALLKVNGGSNIYYREYEYDDVGNITQFITSAAGQAQEEQIFTYDSLGRLKTAIAVEGPAPYDHKTTNPYAYDAIGNLRQMAGNSYGYTEVNWNGGCSNNPTQTLPHAVRQVGSNYYCYDKNGNMTKRVEGSTIYNQTFDVENRLKTVSLTSSNIVTNFAYDASGQRLRTAVAPSGSPVANDTRTFTTYPFPGYEVEQTDTWLYLCADKGGTNCSWQWGHTSTVTRKTYFLGGQAVATQVVSSPAQSGDGFYYLHSDHLGSSSLLTNSSGVKVAGSETRYYPYGAQRLAPTLPADNITDRDFTGQKENSYIKLIYMNARWYDSQIGRFVSADSIVPQANNPQAYNRYSYVYNNPIVLVDPSGHCAKNSDNPAFDENDDLIRFDCSLDEFDAMPIAERLLWMQKLSELLPTGHQDWFNNIIGIIQGFIEFGLAEQGSWLSVVDAGILQGIQDGYAMNDPEIALGSSSNPGAAQWKSFFSLLFSPERDSQTEELIRRWGMAERTATNHGISIAADRGLYASPAELIFLGVGDVYRGVNASGRHVPMYIAAAVGAVIDGVSGTENGLDTMVDLGMALTDPRTLINGHAPVYYVSATIWENYGHWEWPWWMTGN